MTDEHELRKRLSDDFIFYASHCLKIRTKEGSVAPFRLNSAQLHIDRILNEQLLTTGKIRIIILKGRQQGCSTLIEGRFYWRVTHRMGTRAFILTHDAGATNNLYDMVQRYHENCPEIIRPPVGTHNAKELNFAHLDSGYKIGTAGNKAVGRSNTIQLFHGSEVAFWPNASEHAAGILQAIPNSDGTEVIFESTANGIGNYFHHMWELAESNESEYLPIFIPWFWQPEYEEKIIGDFIITEEEEDLRSVYQLTNNQLAWRRKKIIELGAAGGSGDKLFRQEYPCNSSEAFLSTTENNFIDSILVEKAKKCQAQGYGPLVIGVDPARFGKDKTAIIKRQGRLAFGLETYQGKDTMQVTGIIVGLINELNPAKIFVDVVGLGAGIIDRLRELGYGHMVLSVNAGEKALKDNLYANKSAEMWALMKKWLEDEPCQIPDSATLHNHLCFRGYDYDSKHRLVMQSKKELTKSPDEADALALTFSYPISNVETNMNRFSNPAIKI